MAYPHIPTAVPLDTPSDAPVATSVPVDAYNPPAVGRQVTEGFFERLEMPGGLAREFKGSLQHIPRRIWIIDNSGSMQTTDGHRIVFGPAGREGMVTTSRWEELGDALRWHARVAAHLGAPTEFRMLNPPGGGSPQVLQFGSSGAPEEEVKAVERMLSSGPTGRTPLCEQIRQVIAQLKAEEPVLRAAGQRVVLVIASDGAATDGDIAEAMKPLQNLPVWVVVRLCTDDDKVLQYWNQVDEDLELDMDVLDDLTGEAAEVSEHNAWLTYAPILHRLREWGTTRKIFDVLDEKPLAVSEMKELVTLILGADAEDLPDPQLDWGGFKAQLSALLSHAPTVWDPLRSRRREWFDLKRMQKRYELKKQPSCVLM
ncbi:hypothetical protein AB1Y20_004697 [Prymnesium parvum]|uniref:VWFA domain-containing protein n=1 Tax=Prymnesium parvum TaxID=97485 RepID=A0AB34IXD8_PRYPA